MNNMIHDRNAERTLTLLKNFNQGMEKNDQLLETLILNDNQLQRWLDLTLCLMIYGRERKQTVQFNQRGIY